MAPNSNLIIVRHSQAEHNVDLDYSIPDAPLTQLGKAQSAELPGKTTQLQNSVDVILTSALKRTLQSTLLGWSPAVKRIGIENVILLPQAQECNAYPCDTGSPKEVLERDPELKGLNFSSLSEEWTSKRGFYAPDAASIAARAQWLRQYMRSRPEQNILLVAHGDILRQLTGSKAGPSTHQFKNAEVNLYKFDPSSVNDDACWLHHVQFVTAEGVAQPTSSDMASGNVAGGPQLPVFNSGSLDIGNDVDEAGKRAVAELENRVQSKMAAVESKASELKELEERLAAAERKKAELEAKGIKI